MYSYSNKKTKWYKPETFKGKIILTIFMLLIVRIGCQVPVPFVDVSYLSELFSSNTDIYSMLNAFTGGSFLQLSFFAFGVSPYITASIVLQLLGVAFPRLAEIQKDGETGRKKWDKINYCVGVLLALLQSVSMAIVFGRQGLLTTYTWWSVIIVSIAWTIGVAFITAIGQFISKNGFGNGISLILMINIISEFPGMAMDLYTKFIKGKTVINMIANTSIIIIICLIFIGLVVILYNAEKKIKIQYPTNKQYVKTQDSYIPVKLNTAGVMPIILASTLYSLPIMFFANSSNKTLVNISKFFSSSAWFDVEHIWYTIGFVIYGILVIAFAYFYTSITFNPLEIANNLKKSNGVIPGIRPGKPTSDYIEKNIKYMTFIGAVLLFIIAEIPTFLSLAFNISSLSIGGTSVIIVVGVIVETTSAIKAQCLTLKYNASKQNKSIFGIPAKVK